MGGARTSAKFSVPINARAVLLVYACTHKQGKLVIDATNPLSPSMDVRWAQGRGSAEVLQVNI